MAIELKVHKTKNGFEVFGYSNGDCYGNASACEGIQGFDTYEEAEAWALTFSNKVSRRKAKAQK